MQAQISSNSASIAQAECLAESGINYAIYNLSYPANSPTPAAPYWTGTTGNISLTGGSFNVSVTPSGSNYDITANGICSAPTGTTITRTITVVVQMTVQPVAPGQGFGDNGPITLGANQSVYGDLHTTGAVTLNAGSSVSGAVYATSVALAGGTESSFVQVPSSGVVAAPTTVANYQTYTLGGLSYSGKLLTTAPAAGTVLGPTATNPAGVYYFTGSSMTFNGVTINGTLIATTGTVTITGTGTTTITPMSGFPGLVAHNRITFSGTSANLTVNGLAWASAGLSGAGTAYNFTVNGSLLIPTSPGLGTYSGKLALTYKAANVQVPNFSTQTQVPIITVVSWSE
jgi:hypothetical protein